MNNFCIFGNQIYSTTRSGQHRRIGAADQEPKHAIVAGGCDLHPRASAAFPRRTPTADIKPGLPRMSAEGVARPSSHGHIGHSARWSPRFRKRGRRTRCRAGISDMYTRQLPGRSHTPGRHRRTSCDEAPEKTPALRRRKPGTPIDPLQSASCGTQRGIRGVMFNKARRNAPAHWKRGRKGRCSACERRP
jgi:hypothetical protein